jgi:predicted O-methyltransferase YrrM
MITSVDLTGEEYHQTISDVYVLKYCASLLLPNPVIVNIGACFGTSAMALLEARPDSFIFSVDISVSYGEIENLKLAGLYSLNRVIRVLASSQDVGLYWPHKVDMCYVDGDHSYDGVVQDIRVWRELVKPGGVLLFHDYGKDFLPHVKAAIDAEMIGYVPFIHEESMLGFRL